MQEFGTIVEMGEKTMQVEFERSSMCDKCGACEHAHQAMHMEVARMAEAQVGDRVEVELPEKTILHAAGLAYGIPLCLLLFGLWLGNFLGMRFSPDCNPDVLSAGLGLLFAAGAYLVLRWTEKARSSSGKYAPRAVRLVHKEDEEGRREQVG